MLKESLRLDKKLRAFYEKHERLLVPGLLVSGFIFDVITFRTLSMKTTMQFLGVYAILAAVALLYVNIFDGRKTPGGWAIFRYLRALAPYVIQLTFGALLSSSLLFYWYSGSFSVSWPLFALITGVMISSEIFRHYYLRPIVLFSVYTFLLISYFSLLLPFVLTSLSGWIFILSGVMSTLIVLLLIAVLSRLAEHIEKQRTAMYVAVLGVFVSMSMLYFMNVIPPLPLSIREAGVYHDIVREGGEYTLVGEEENFWQGLLPGQTLHAQPNDSIYVYTAIFAPAQLRTIIYHRWEYHDPETGKWRDVSLLHFPIRGGRIEGYRGYTVKSHLDYGKWRVTVQNERGQVLGRVVFTLEAP